MIRTAHERLRVSRQVAIESPACRYETQEAVRRYLALIRKSDEFISRFQPAEGYAGVQD